MASLFEKNQQEIAELQAKLEKLKADQAGLRVEEAKVLADQFWQKLTKAGFTAEEGLDAYKAVSGVKLSVGSSKPRAKRGEAKPRPVRAVEAGKTYKDPATGAEWTAGSKGRTVGWLQAYISQGRSAGDFVMNG